VPLASAIALGFGFLAALWLFGRALAIFVLALTLASALAPAVSWLSRRTPHALAVIIVYLMIAAAVVTLALWVVPAMSGDAAQLTDQAPQLIERLRQAVSRILPFDANALSSTVQNSVPRIVAASSQLASAAVDVLVVVFLSLYLLLAAPGVDPFIRSLLPRSRRRRVSRILRSVAREMGGYFRGAAINGVAVAALTWSALAFIGVEYAGPLAIVAFLGELVPYLGPVIAALPAIAVALTQSTSTAVSVAVAYLAIQQIEGHVLTPVIMHSQTHISPAMVIIALTMGYTVGGILGALAAIPVFAAARVLVRHALVPELRRRARAGHPVGLMSSE
jgi:predicted PurR-regulated permease PerM